MTEKPNDSPSLDIPRNPPYGWIQWKGTKVCMDIHCKCGALMHLDADFAYHIKCGECGQVYECDGHINLIPLAHEPENTILVKDDDICWDDDDD